MFEWNLGTSFPCPGYGGGCFKYPINRLQKHDNDLGLSFYINIHVYNNAGHFITVPTDTFKIPSAYPPGHGIVVDVDPEHESLTYDTKIHFTPHTLCLRGYGFKHSESVEIQVGIGSNNSTDNVVPYSALNHSSGYHCIYSSKIEFQQTYFALVKASCTGGFTVSASNGIVVLNRTMLLVSLVVNLGEKCSANKLFHSNHTVSTISNTTMTFAADVGKRYKLSFIRGSIASVVSTEGIIERDTEGNNNTFFVSFVPNPVISLSSSRAANQTVEILIHKCPYMKYMIRRNSVSAHWFYRNHLSYGLTFEIAILKMKTIAGNITFVPFKEYESASDRYSHTFFNIDFELDKSYKLAVKQCTKAMCLDPVISDTFEVSVPPRPGRILMSQIIKDANNSCTRINLQWENFKSDNSIIFYQWAVFADNVRKRILTGWQTIKENATELYQVSK